MTWLMMDAGVGREKTIEDLGRVMALGPICQGVWCVDRPGAYRRVMRAMRDEGDMLGPDGESIGLFGVEVKLVGAEQVRDAMAYLIEELKWPVERARGLWPVCQAGVWAVYSDGSRVRWEV